MNQFQAFPTTEPMVMVHRGWQSSRKSSSSSRKHTSPPRNSTSPPSLTTNTSAPPPPKGGPNTIQQFAFVNVTEPGRPKDAETRKLVRGHVVKDSTRKRRLQRQLDAVKASGSSSKIEEGEGSSSQQQLINPAHLPPPPPVPTLGPDPHPWLSPIIYHLTAMGDAMYPLVSSFRFNPVSPAAWFDCALKDDALFHAILYTSSTYQGLLSGVTESKEAISHVGKSLTLVNTRLAGMSEGREVVSEVVESTVRAVSCLGISECLRGNYKGWRVHMLGLKQMVDLKGGLQNFSVTLQLKIHRVDLMGASEHTVPAFFAINNQLPSLPAREPQDPTGGAARSAILTFLDLLPISRELSNSLSYMHGLSQSVSRILASPKVLNGTQQAWLLKHIYALRYSLLPSQDAVEFPDAAAQTLDEALRLGALLYVSETPKEFPSAAVGPMKVVSRLRELVMLIQMWNDKEAALVVWLLFMGGIAARNTDDRIWFVTQLENLTRKLGLGRWGEVRLRLEGLWWVSAIHEKPCREVWDEVVVLKEGAR